MRRSHHLRLLLTLLVTAPLGAQDSTLVFPTVTGRSLEGRELVFPRDLPGDRNVVLIAFERWHQREVDSWMPALRRLRETDPALAVYELPTLGNAWRPVRGFIDGGMRGGIPDKAVREATVTLYLDKGPFKRALGIRDEDHIQLLVLDRDGRIRLRIIGPATGEGVAVLETALRHGARTPAR
jgi:hypothetical protein